MTLILYQNLAGQSMKSCKSLGRNEFRCPYVTHNDSASACTSGELVTGSPKASVKNAFPAAATSNLAASTRHAAVTNAVVKMIQSIASCAERDGGTTTYCVSHHLVVTWIQSGLDPLQYGVEKREETLVLGSERMTEELTGSTYFDGIRWSYN
ncbi:hypothetical protein ANO14919_070890 [Xylariales sp. No.14919]|nr:hypothetical protein ANO14919_070890 [Xylariales sp. No.14919]